MTRLHYMTAQALRYGFIAIHFSSPFHLCSIACPCILEVRYLTYTNSLFRGNTATSLCGKVGVSPNAGQVWGGGLIPVFKHMGRGGLKKNRCAVYSADVSMYMYHHHTLCSDVFRCVLNV